jgi:matrixin
MKMQIIMAVLPLALLMWVEIASAQDPPKTYSVSVSVHKDLSEPLSDGDVEEILDKASKLLQKNSGHACGVAFTLKGPVRIFGSPATPAIVGKRHIKAVHRVGSDVAGADFHVKVVEEIGFCRGKRGRANGCSFPPKFRSIIVVHPKLHRNREGELVRNFPDHVLWAHEFGHLTGLGHRKDEHALMTNCGVNKDSVRVNEDDCRCLLRGPPGRGPCKLPPALWCTR